MNSPQIAVDDLVVVADVFAQRFGDAASCHSLQFDVVILFQNFGIFADPTNRKSVGQFLGMGEMAPRYPRGHYYIVSGDQDFEPLVTYLQEHNLHISQHPDLASLPFLAGLPKPAPAPAVVSSPPPAPVALPLTVPVAPKLVDLPKPVAVIAKPVAPKKPVVSREEKFIAGLKNSKKANRPSTLKRLQAHVKNALGKEETAEKVAAVISKLIKTHVLSVAASGKVTYK